MQADGVVLVTERLHAVDPAASVAELRALEPSLMKALRVLWATGVAHGDIAVRNLALDKDGNVRLFDLGRAHDFNCECETASAACEAAEAADRPSLQRMLSGKTLFSL